MSHHAKKKILPKIILTAIVFGIIIYLFQNSFYFIILQLKEMEIRIMIMVVALSIAYNVIEGCNIALLAQKYNANFSYLDGVKCSYYQSFYRVVTFGSGTNVAALFYLDKKELKPSQSLGVITIQYILHKMGIALFCGIGLILDYAFLMQHYKEYIGYLWIGFGITIVISIVLVLVCVSKKFHKFLIRCVNGIQGAKWFQRKFRNHLATLDKVKDEINNLNTIASTLLCDRKIMMREIRNNLGKLLCWYMISYVLLKNVPGVQPYHYVIITSYVTALAGVIPTPAGIGSIEGVYVLLFAVLVGSIEAGAAMLVYRFATFLLPFILGGLGVLWQNVKGFNAS